MLRRVPCLPAIVFAACLGVLLQPAFAQQKEKDKKITKVVRYVGHKERYKYQSKYVLLVGVEPLEGGPTTELIVANRDMNKQEYDPVPQAADTILDLKKGEVIKIELDDSKPRPLVRYAKRYALKPGEDDPRTYVFENSFPKTEGRTTYTAVVLSKYDQMHTVAVQPRHDKEGATGADPDVMGVVEKLKTGDVVEAEVRETGAGRPPVLTHIERYAPPQNGRFVKVSEAEVEGQKAPAVELQHEGKTVTALVNGKMQSKRWVPDGKVLSAARKLKADAEVVYRAREEDGKLYLKEIEPAPKASEEKGASAAAREATDDDARRGRRKEK